MTIPRIVLAACGAVLMLGFSLVARPQEPAAGEHVDLDPAAWGEDHVGKPMPDFIESGECLFCHRNDIGETWSTTDRHAHTIRAIRGEDPTVALLARNDQTAPFAEQVDLILGNTRQKRFLRRSEQYGKADLLTVSADAGRGRRMRLAHTENPHWDEKTFGASCIGCHTTGVDSQAQTFSFVAHDCFVCHGDADLEHSNEPELIHLSSAREDPPQVVNAICAQCHVRFGKSKSTGLPYPNNFVAGDNLFRDFQFDFALADDQNINPADLHVLVNVRDVAFGRTEMTCLSCHELHADSTKRHRKVANGAYCNICHEPDQPKRVHKQYQVHSECCRY